MRSTSHLSTPKSHLDLLDTDDIERQATDLSAATEDLTSSCHDLIKHHLQLSKELREANKRLAEKENSDRLFETQVKELRAEVTFLEEQGRLRVAIAAKRHADLRGELAASQQALEAKTKEFELRVEAASQAKLEWQKEKDQLVESLRTTRLLLDRFKEDHARLSQRYQHLEQPTANSTRQQTAPPQTITIARTDQRPASKSSDIADWRRQVWPGPPPAFSFACYEDFDDSIESPSTFDTRPPKRQRRVSVWDRSTVRRCASSGSTFRSTSKEIIDMTGMED